MSMDINILTSSSNSNPVHALWQEWIVEHPLSTRQEQAAALALLYWLQRRSKIGH